MIELTVLQYDHDEESLGFPEPPRADAPPMSLGERVSVGLVAVAVLFILLGASFSLGTDTWWGFLMSFGLLAVGGAAAFWFRYRGTTPGIRNDSQSFRSLQRRGWMAWGLAIGLTVFYVVLYWYTDLEEKGMADVFAGPIALMNPLARLLTGSPADRWFLYGFLYTATVLAFGGRMFMRYRHNRYQLVRTGSVMFFQLGFAFLLPGLLKRLNQPDHYFTYFWPLKPEYAWPGPGGIDTGTTIGLFMFGFGIVAFLVGTPILTYFFGKRWYCSWVCGCGGLAETLGDPWRQLSDKSNTAWKIERVLIYAVLLFVIVVTAILWIDDLNKGGTLGSLSSGARKTYGFLIINLFSGVIGVGFYPLMGARVWCRFGCPMAAVLGILQRLFSRFRITTNGGQCMSCGNCSTMCEMGIDVRAYAQRGENIVRASCVGCGICAAVCPRGVLKLENGTSSTGRFATPDGGPLDQLIADMKRGADPRRDAGASRRE